MTCVDTATEKNPLLQSDKPTQQTFPIRPAGEEDNSSPCLPVHLRD